METTSEETRPSPRRGTRETVGGVLFGVGVGALVDGFVLHQLLQWHHLWSRRTPVETLAGLESNTLADGVFHSAFLVVLVVGVLMRRHRLPHQTTLGLLLVGWGAFQVMDQLVFHLALGAHHIREDAPNPELYDWSFFGIGIAFGAVGLGLLRRADSG